MFDLTPAYTPAGPALTTIPAALRRPVMTRPKLTTAVLVALALAVPGGMYAHDAAAGQGDAPVHVAKKGSFDVTEF